MKSNEKLRAVRPRRYVDRRRRACLALLVAVVGDDVVRFGPAGRTNGLLGRYGYAPLGRS